MVNPPQKKISLDFALFFILVFYFIITTTYGSHVGFIPIAGAPVNFAFIFLAFAAILAYFFLDQAKISEEKKHWLKVLTVSVVIMLTVFSAILYQIVLRQKGANLKFTHDGVVQTEEAVKFLSQGKNPYAVDYRHTPFGQFVDEYSQGKRENPAWSHYVYLPFLPVFSLPFYLFSAHAFDFFDQRIVYALIFLACLFVIYKLPEDKNKKIIGLIVFSFNPLFFPYLLQGYNDVFVFFWLIFSLYLLKLGKYYWSAVILALACSAKQSAWLVLPFYLFYLFILEDKAKLFKSRLLAVLKKFLPFIIISIAVIAPFLIWGFHDFIDDIYRFPAGSIASNFPMVGYGVSYLLYLMGVVKSIWDYFPFWILQAVICLPLLYYLIRKQRVNNSLSFLVSAYGMFLLVFWFFSRFFNENYISYLSLIFLTAYLIEEKEPALIK